MHTLFPLFFYATLLAPITGVLVHVPFLGFELLPSDVFIIFFFLYWAYDKLRHDRKIRLGRVGQMILVFLFVMLLSWIVNLFRFPFIQMAVGMTYMIRFAMYIVLAPMTYDILTRHPELKRNILLGFLAPLPVLILFGFLQLIFYPNFYVLGLHLLGWDPHIGRMTATWLDPNFLSGFFALILGLVMSLGLYYRRNGDKQRFLFLAAVALLGIIALYLTFSRSGILAFLMTVGVLAFFKSRKLLLAAILVSTLVFGFSPRTQERVGEMWISAKTLVGLEEQRALDPTAALRVWSWSFAKEIIQDYPLLGIGYSRYQYEINYRGHALLSDHSSGGSDSSLLTLWATTGLFGLLSFLAVGFVALVLAFKRMFYHEDFESYVLAGFVASFAGLLVHSVFVNSLVFPLIMVYLWIGIGLIDAEVS